MEKNDFYVIAYRILKYFYECLKAGVKPDMEDISAARLGIPAKYRLFVIHELLDRWYIEGVKAKSGTNALLINDPMITGRGIDYLFCDPMMLKAKSVLIELECE